MAAAPPPRICNFDCQTHIDPLLQSAVPGSIRILLRGRASMLRDPHAASNDAKESSQIIRPALLPDGWDLDVDAMCAAEDKTGMCGGAPVVIGELFPGCDSALGKDDDMVRERAGVGAAHSDGAAVAVGLARVVQQVCHVACAQDQQPPTSANRGIAMWVIKH